jgi:AcrR family transcriptional regulator
MASDITAEKPQTRWRRRKDARAPEILDAALSVFAEKGFAGARMEDIAAKAGVTKGTIYLYFQNKEAVFKSLVRDSIGTTLSGVLEASKTFEGSARDLLRFVLTTMGHFLTTSDRVVLPKIILAEAGNFPELLRFYREEIIANGLGVLSGVMARGMERGEFRRMNPDHAARLAIAPMLLSALWRTTFAPFDEEPFDYQGFIAVHIDTLLKGLSP